MSIAIIILYSSNCYPDSTIPKYNSINLQLHELIIAMILPATINWQYQCLFSSGLRQKAIQLFYQNFSVNRHCCQLHHINNYSEVNTTDNINRTVDTVYGPPLGARPYIDESLHVSVDIIAAKRACMSNKQHNLDPTCNKCSDLIG